MVGANRLQPTSAATTVRSPNGKKSVLNGPFAETREQLGGYYLIGNARSRRRAVLGGALPRAAHGSIEVRPVWAM